MASLQTEVDSGAPGSAIWKTRSVGVEKIARAAIGCSITINVVASMGTFNTGLLPAELTYLQQAVAVLMWGVLIYASAFVRPPLRLQFNPDLIVLVAFYAFAVISVFWTSLNAAAIMKSLALAMTTFGAFCLITRIDMDEVVRATALGLFILVAASAFVALAVPDIGIDHSWMHNGQWQGVYESKQTLGFVGAYLMFFACYLKMKGQGWPAFLLTFVLASTCVLASESRGAGAVALAACALLLTSMWSVICMRLYAVLPFVMCLLAGALIFYFYATGYDAIHVGDASVDLTERTFIWHYAISHFDDAPLLGFGINGFWTIPSIYDYFEQNHGWVLDNYHSGYIAILMETGFLGYTLFAASVLLFSSKVLHLISARAIDRSHCALIIGFAVLSFQTNFTETTFLRSTMFTSVLLVAFFFATCRPVPQTDL
ncbi:exopolysaccharide production protein ExoQ [Bradyrhizobium diazoefficiens]|uniref:Blr3366 protein n=1 Tax=Bradyrhizobium diazoefficiens (strain JCM 10833 / BCRC 13528 / IAM 13628 / NBRC 14792 / USDA 110) TaxID=224911 RepID=Q89PW4_BRADU|nr:O-antigen ligase family protein [Bradyrhizobium diazoefficiens]MBP1066685.1 O-antigen ligase [Bradyrhizobium japonicum]AND88773.1 ligase [Bradyrhizobium diazoefficiens USDA 110]AWO90344.1 O-antigen ligase family protein [Bradyrhizobium diazoefficiens]MBR0860488.1 O-antigen ligase family protein [Bradyrhizobium diazoefficiens]MBR0884979.1 O-antigen ligase family protein [Bradyrhizobium diazoefficiens]